MPPFRPVTRNEIIYYLHQLGFTGPYAGGKHQFMVKENVRLHIPNPHQGDIGRNLLGKILKQAEIDRDEWENV